MVHISLNSTHVFNVLWIKPKDRLSTCFAMEFHLKPDSTFFFKKSDLSKEVPGASGNGFPAHASLVQLSSVSLVSQVAFMPLLNPYRLPV